MLMFSVLTTSYDTVLQMAGLTETENDTNIDM